MKKTLKGFLVGFLAAIVLLAGVSVFAQGIDVSFKSIKILINGQKKVPSSDMKPLIYNGRTYVALRFIGEAFNKDVNWNSTTSTITISDKSTSTATSTPKPSSNQNQASPPIVFNTLLFDKGDMFTTRVEENTIGTPELKLVAENVTDKDIVAFEFTCSFVDSFDRPVYRAGTDAVFKGIVQDADLKNKNTPNTYMDSDKKYIDKMFKKKEYSFNLVLYDLAQRVKTDSPDWDDGEGIKLTSVKFADGSIWTAK